MFEQSQIQEFKEVLYDNYGQTKPKNWLSKRSTELFSIVGKDQTDVRSERERVNMIANR